MGTAPVIAITRVGIGELFEWVVDVNVVRSVGGVTKHSVVATVEFVTAIDRLGIPIRPVDMIFKQGQRKDMWHFLSRYNYMFVFSVQVHGGYIVQMSVGPIESLRKVVQCEGVRPGDVVLVSEDPCEVTPVHADLAYVSL